MADYSLNNILVSESSFMTTPQDSLTECKEDFTSVFGDYHANFAREMNLMNKEENEETPFGYDSVMKNIFVEDYNAHNAQYESYYDEDDEEELPGLTFEC